MPYEFGDYPVPSTLATGTASITTFLRGDGTWAAPAAGTGDMLKSVYDNSGTVGVVDNAEALAGAPANLYARRDGANTFAGQQTFNSGILGGLDGGAGNSLKSVINAVFPRSSDFTSVFQDNQDELGLATFNPAWAISGTSNAVAMIAADVQSLFIDDASTFTASGTVFPVVITADMVAAPITPKGNANFRLGLTFRGVYPTSVLIEVWNGTAFVTVQNYTGLGAGDFPNGFWLSGNFFGNTNTFNMDKLRVTLGGTNPVAAGNPFYLQRLLLYHVTGAWDTFRLHKLGGAMYGNANWQSGAPQVAGLNVWHPGNLTPGVTTPVKTVSTNYTVLPSDATIFVDATAGPVTITLPTSASAVVGTQGQRVRVKKNDTSPNAVTIVATGGQIDGAASAVIGTPYNAFEFIPVPGTANWGGF